MKIYLDDLRDTPEGWVRVYWPQELINLLSPEVTDISLDHDLGDDERGTGYDVLLYIEEQVFFNKEYHVPNIFVHSSNTSAKNKMMACIEKIHKMKK